MCAKFGALGQQITIIAISNQFCPLYSFKATFGFLASPPLSQKISDNAEAQKMEINFKGVNYTQKCSTNSKMALTVAVI